LTIDEVNAGLGQPQVVTDVGKTNGKPVKLYLYKDWKVTFTDGKVSKYEDR